jgi:hypothetical protein
MSDVISKKEEKRLLDLGRGVFANSFPNPERKGCPGSSILKTIAAGKGLGSGADEDDWISHCSRCSPCFRELAEFRRVFVRQRQIRRFSAAAIVIAAVCVGTWVAMSHRAKTYSGGAIAENRAPAGAMHPEVLDLRNWSAMRSDQAVPPEGQKPLELRRALASLVVYLPMGSPPGAYEVRIAGGPNQRPVGVGGVARVENGNTVLRVRLDLSELIPGQYSLSIRQPPWDWRSYPFTLR